MPIHPSTTRPILVLALILTSGMGTLVGPARAADWSLKMGDDRRPIVAAASVDGPLFHLETLAAALGLRVQSLDKKSVRLETAEGRSLLCQAGRSAVMLENQVRILSRSLDRNRSGLLVAPQFVEEALAPLLGREIRAALGRGVLEILETDSTEALRVSWSQELGRTVLQVPVRASTYAGPPSVRRSGAGLVADLPGRLDLVDGSVPHADLEITPGEGNRSLLHVRPAPGYRTVPLSQQEGLKVALVAEREIQGPPKEPKLKAASRSNPPVETPGVLSSDPDAGLFRLVVIDPGHGGGETGAVGPGGTEEKTVVLQVAMRLRALLESRGVEVAVTRTEDIEMPLDERTSFANQLKADLFVSLHANASTAPQAKGFETFFLSREATDEFSRTIAAIESNTLGVRRSKGRRPVAGALEMTLWEMAQSQFLRESERLAGRVQKELNRVAGTPDRGVKRGPLTVLMGATMPAILVEIGFLSNPQEELKIRDANHQQKVADAIARAILAFGEERDARAAARTAP